MSRQKFRVTRIFMTCCTACIFSYPSDASRSLRKLPIVHILDDSCALHRHNKIHYPEESKLIYGERMGCFETPSDTLKPNSGIDCPDITPLTLTDSTQTVNREAMNNSNPLIHPDSNSLARYCLGTKLHGLEKITQKSEVCFPQCCIVNTGKLH